MSVLSSPAPDTRCPTTPLDAVAMGPMGVVPLATGRVSERRRSAGALYVYRDRR